MAAAVALVVLGACSADESGSSGGRDGDPPTPLLPADGDDGSGRGAAGLGATTTSPRISQPPAGDGADCPSGSVRWVTEKVNVEDQGVGDPRAWFVTVTGRVENQTSARIVLNPQDLEIFILRPPAWDGMRPYYASAPAATGQLGPSGRTTWRAHETLQSQSRPRVGSVRAAPSWEDEELARRCPAPSGVGAKPRPAL